MPKISYVNGRYLPHRAARVHIEDRGYQFADGVYEVIAVADGRLIDSAAHLNRLERSLRETRLAAPVSFAALALILGEVLRRNGLRDGMLYLQITRGVAPRDHAFPKGPTRPSLIVTCRRLALPRPGSAVTGVGVIILPDIRWKRTDIKSISLLPNVLAKQQAVEAGAYEAWLMDAEGQITEGTSSNAWIVDGQGRLITRRADHTILGGVTRLSLAAVAARLGVDVVERAFSVAEAKAACEAFLTSTTAAIRPVVSIDGISIGEGRPGVLTLRLREAYLAAMAASQPRSGQKARRS